MTTRPTTTILGDVITQTGRQAAMGRKLRKNVERNWLLDVVLSTYARAADGGDPTDLDTIVLAAFDEAGFGPALREHGRLYTEMPEPTRTELFGTSRSAGGYTVAQLVGDLPGIEAAVLAQPNATDVDVVGVHEGVVPRSAARRPRRSVVAEYGSELIRAVEADLDGEPPTDPFSIKATRFRCADETGIDWLGSDEPYWIFGSLGGGVPVTSKSHTFGDVDSGDTVSFGPSEGWIWGPAGTPKPLPEGEIGALVQLWEHDGGDETEVKAATAAAFAAAAGILAATGVGAWVAALVAGVGAVVQWLVGFMDEDHIADQTFVFTRQTLLDQAGKVGSAFELTRQFTDGDGDYTLTLTVSHLAQPTPPSTTVTVPQVVGMQRAAAVTRVRNAGLLAQVVNGGGLMLRLLPTDPNDPGQPPISQHVISQSPPGGSVVARGSSVRLTVRFGDEF